MDSSHTNMFVWRLASAISCTSNLLQNQHVGMKYCGSRCSGSSAYLCSIFKVCTPTDHSMDCEVKRVESQKISLKHIINWIIAEEAFLLLIFSDTGARGFGVQCPTLKMKHFSIYQYIDMRGGGGEERREKLTKDHCRVIIKSHALKQSARLSGDLEREAMRQDKTREREVIKSWSEQVPRESIKKDRVGRGGKWKQMARGTMR